MEFLALLGGARRWRGEVSVVAWQHYFIIV